MITGAIKHDGGNTYVIIADNGIQYDPVNLPYSFRHDGLRIAFRARRTVRKGLHITLWLGPVIEIIEIVKL